MARGDTLLSFFEVCVMDKPSTTEVPKSGTPHSEAMPPNVLAARLEAFRADLSEHILDRVRALNEELLREHTALKPLMSVQDVARTLNVSTRTTETLIASGKLHPLWIKGQRRFDPDTVAAYMRSCARPRKMKQRV